MYNIRHAVFMDINVGKLWNFVVSLIEKHRIFIMYKVSLHERKNNKWRIVLSFDGHKHSIKTIEYNDLDTAIKELKRAIEIREKAKKGEIKWVR